MAVLSSPSAVARTCFRLARALQYGSVQCTRWAGKQRFTLLHYIGMRSADPAGRAILFAPTILLSLTSGRVAFNGLVFEDARGQASIVTQVALDTGRCCTRLVPCSSQFCVVQDDLLRMWNVQGHTVCPYTLAVICAQAPSSSPCQPALA